MWRFLHALPPHYVSRKLGAAETIAVDGKLDDAAWADAPWTTPMVDITHHAISAQNAVPSPLQARAKLRWDDRYLYVGAELREQLVIANITGHNGPNPPYHDNDFEAFIDPSGTTQHYKEFEMSARNATYDVLWGVPDGEGLQCAGAPKPGSPPPPAYLPTCVNTSFPGYAGSWTMANNATPGVAGGGLTAATSYDAAQYGEYVHPFAVWTAEIAFPLRSGGGHGGLLDGARPNGLAAASDPSQQPQVYWHFDLSRAEHPRKYSWGRKTAATTAAAAGSPSPPPPPPPAATFCPFNCTADLATATPELGAPSSAECAAVRKAWPTLLGVDPWNCYWEWALAAVGPNAYMHRPLFWATLEFVGAPAMEEEEQQQRQQRAAAPIAPQMTEQQATEQPITQQARQLQQQKEEAPPPQQHERCLQIEWPGRYLARTIFVAQQAYRTTVANGSSYAGAAEATALVSACAAAAGCNATDLAFALQGGRERRGADVEHDAAPSPPIVSVELRAEANATTLSHDCPARPCFQATVHVGAPVGASAASPYGGGDGDGVYRYVTTIDSNSRVETTHTLPAGQRPCLPEE